MNSNQSGRGRRRSRGGRGRGDGRRSEGAPKAPAKKTLMQRITAFFTGGEGKPAERPARSQQRERNGAAEPPQQQERQRPGARRPEAIDVTTPRLYVGNLSFDATESDLFELFNGVGKVQNAEIVTHKHNQRSKGFAFVQMLTVDEAKRAVTELHDKEFMGRKLVVSGAKADQHSRS